GGPVGFGDAAVDGLVGCERRQAVHRDPVVLTDLVVGGGVGEGQGEEALLFGVGLVDPSERAGEDGDGPPVAGFHGGVFAGRALAVVLVAHRAPAHACLGQVPGDVRERAGVAVEGVDPFPGHARVRVDHAGEQVGGDVLEVTAV